MKCEHPLSTTGALFPCGKCVPCTVNRKKVWTHRLELEASKWSDNAFVTLTYDDAHLPKGGSVDVKTLQDFVKRLRRYHEPLRLRYFACGEYGDHSWRPHYHGLLFNFLTCLKHQTQFNRQGEIKCCQRCRDVKSIWGFGNVYLARVEPQSIQYVCGYVVKKMTHRQDARLEGREPEFVRMSLKPGIGAGAMEDAKSAIAGTSIRKLTSLEYSRMPRALGKYLAKKSQVVVPKPLLSRLKRYDIENPYNSELLVLQQAAKASKSSARVEYEKAYAGKFASQRSKLKLRGMKNETL